MDLDARRIAIAPGYMALSLMFDRGDGVGVVGKAGRENGLQGIEMVNVGLELPQPLLAVGDFPIEPVLQPSIRWLAVEIFVGVIANRDRGSGDDVVEPPIQTIQFDARRLQRGLD
ncbi:hypothetical protein [Rhodopseudomonas sp. BAL398]|uniref:hypothetical protein n=1 Tax=Rhodopseudomonas sp. BAL398 TaxID=3034676 RepID=UPI001364D4E2|nr:hypothetical protein [Rhodopseudomonas sp. BAL398]WOK17685.1 hypothetical protein RBJ75_26825 [Rhodopseudomonas sp. BAL398]